MSLSRDIAAFVLVALVLAAGAAAVVTRDQVSGPLSATVTLATSKTRVLSPPGRAGDIVTQTWRVTDRNGRSIGRWLLWCNWVQTHTRFCVGELRMPGGTIQVQGASQTRLNGELAITGGTGIYERGGGTIKFTAIGARKSVLSGAVS